MGRRRRLLERIPSGRSDANIPFEQARTPPRALGCLDRFRGSRHKFVREDFEELISHQNIEGKCKPCQVRQIREILLRYKLHREL